MLAAKNLVLLCQDIYENPLSFDSVYDNGFVYVGKKVIHGQTVLAFRGSKTLTDWLDDFEAIPIAVPLVGTVHEGFWQGVEDIYERVGLRSGDSVILTGHSLGCAHAALFARLCLLRHGSVSQLYLFAPPRIGFQDFYDGLRNVGEIKAWQNALDPVPDVPFPLSGLPWAQFPLITITELPGGMSDIDPIAYHAIELYERGI